MLKVDTIHLLLENTPFVTEFNLTPTSSVMAAHPLKNHLILSIIFRYRPNTLASVKIHRLVCKAWKEACDVQWKALSPLTILQNHEYEPMEEGTTSIKEVVQEIEMNRAILTFSHKHFRLKGWNIDIDHFGSTSEQADASLIQRFWGMCGQNITALTLSHCKIPYNYSLLPLAFWRVVPNLESLTLVNCEMSEKDFWGWNHLDEQIEELNESIGWSDNRIQLLIKKRSQPAEAPNNVVLSRQIQWHTENRFKYRSALEPLLRRKRNIRNQCSDSRYLSSNPAPAKLTTLHIHNLKCGNGRIPVGWYRITKTFPDLNRVFVRQPEFRDFNDLVDVVEENPISYLEAVQRKVKEVDVMNISSFLAQMPAEILWKLPSEKLSLDCGFETEQGRVKSMLEYTADDLRKLVLFRAPGNVTKNMNFLKFTPNLKKLKWNTTCYDDVTHGARLHQMLGQMAHPLLAEGIVKNTDGLGENFKLKSLEVFEMVSGAMSVDVFKKLGAWLPNLKALTATVIGDDKLIQIGREWVNLEHLEMAHESFVTADGILKVLSFMGFQKLKGFTWKACSCFVGELSASEMWAVEELRKITGDNVVHPWKNWQQQMDKPSSVKCLCALFEKALFEGEGNVGIFKIAMNASM